MTDRWQRLRQLVERALGMPVAEREPWLQQQCGDDADLLREAHAILASAAADDTFLQPPAEIDAGQLHQSRIGEFEIRHEIGRGGMGAAVYLAWQPSLARPVALKVFAENITTTQAQIERFHREARAVARLQHPGIVTVHAEGRDGPLHWFAMEYVPGHDLARELALQANRRTDGRAILPRRGDRGHYEAIARIVHDAARALHEAHAHGIVHRDVKPGNLLLHREGRIRVGDFGLARDESLGTITRSAEQAGTPHYMSPEQVRRTDQRVDHRTDVYSLGVVLYELLAQHRPFDGTTSDEIREQIRSDEPKPVRHWNSAVPLDLATICHCAMARRPDERYATAAAFADDLARFLDHEAIAARPPRPALRLWRRIQRHRVGIATAALVLAAGAGSWLLASSNVLAGEREQRRTVLQALLRETDWRRLPYQRLLAGRRVLLDLDTGAAATAVPELAAARQRFADLRHDLLAEAGRMLLRDPAGSTDPAVAAAREKRLLDGVLLLQRVAIVFDEPALLQQLGDDPFAPRLSIGALDDAGRPQPGTAGYRVLDGITGMPGPLVDLGPLPVEHRPVVADHLRIVVSVGGRTREFARQFERGTTADRIVVRPIEPTTDDDMVPFDGGVMRLTDAGPMSGLQDRELTIEPFLLDRCEVSIGDYRRFLAAHPEHPTPLGWDQLENDRSHDDLPIAYVGFEDAVAYAEWRGKRLPTHAEWMWAARGPQGRLQPWAQEPGRPPVWRGATRQPQRPLPTNADGVPIWLTAAHPVAGDLDACTPDGLHHLLGNVAEWTESQAPDRDPGGPFQLRPHARVVVGGSWYAQAAGDSLRTIETAGTARSYAHHATGFRCARTP